MMTAPVFAVPRQDKPDNCQAVALHNALRWLGHPENPPVSRWETILENAAKEPRGRVQFDEIAWWVRTHFWLDVLLPAMNYKRWTDEAVGQVLADGYVLVVGYRQDSGNRHAVVVVEPGFVLLDGLRSAEPVPMSAEEMRERKVGVPVALRLPRWG